MGKRTPEQRAAIAELKCAIEDCKDLERSILHDARYRLRHKEEGYGGAQFITAEAIAFVRLSVLEYRLAMLKRGEP